jgi:hypothetical protein
LGIGIDEAQTTVCFQNGNAVEFSTTARQLSVFVAMPFDRNLTCWQSVVEKLSPLLWFCKKF